MNEVGDMSVVPYLRWGLGPNLLRPRRRRNGSLGWDDWWRQKSIPHQSLFNCSQFKPGQSFSPPKLLDALINWNVIFPVSMEENLLLILPRNRDDIQLKGLYKERIPTLK